MLRSPELVLKGASLKHPVEPNKNDRPVSMRHRPATIFYLEYSSNLDKELDAGTLKRSTLLPACLPPDRNPDFHNYASQSPRWQQPDART